jgi:phenylacetate-CoA ligase
VTYRPDGDGTGPFSVFPLLKHAHRTAGFFKLRGISVKATRFVDRRS